METVVKLSLKKDTPKIEVTMKPDEESNYTPEEKATYPKIKKYVKNKYGVNVHTSYIAQVKRMCGLDMGENYNKSKKEKPEVKQCPQAASEKCELLSSSLTADFYDKLTVKAYQLRRQIDLIGWNRSKLKCF